MKVNHYRYLNFPMVSLPQAHSPRLLPDDFSRPRIKQSYIVLFLIFATDRPTSDEFNDVFMRELPATAEACSAAFKSACESAALDKIRTLAAVTGDSALDANAMFREAFKAAKQGNNTVLGLLLQLQAASDTCLLSSSSVSLLLRAACAYAQPGVLSMVLDEFRRRSQPVAESALDGLLIAVEWRQPSMVESLLALEGEEQPDTRRRGGRVLVAACWEGHTPCLVPLLSIATPSRAIDIDCLKDESLRLPTGLGAAAPPKTGLLELCDLAAALWRNGAIANAVNLFCVVRVVGSGSIHPLVEAAAEATGRSRGALPAQPLLRDMFLATVQLIRNAHSGDDSRTSQALLSFLSVFESDTQWIPASACEHPAWPELAGGSETAQPVCDLPQAIMLWTVLCAALPAAGQPALRRRLLQALAAAESGEGRMDRVASLGWLTRAIVWNGVSGGGAPALQCPGRRCVLLSRASMRSAAGDSQCEVSPSG